MSSSASDCSNNKRNTLPTQENKNVVIWFKIKQQNKQDADQPISTNNQIVVVILTINIQFTTFMM